MQLVVSGLFLFPVKSCRGTRVRSAKIDARGIVDNRRYMITDSSGMFVSQRAYEHKKEGIQVTSLAQIQPEIKDGLLILSAPQMGKLYLPLSGSDERRMTAFVWDKPVEVFDQGDTAAMWLTDFISDERPGHYRLVRICDDEVRPSKLGGGQQALDDGYPFMMVSEESLADFNARSTKEVSMERFRPNLVIRGGPAYIEDRLARIRIGSVELTGQTMCARCTMTLLDPKTGRRLGSEPLNTLSKYRHTNANQVMFGRNFIHRGTGELQLFDLIEVMETSDPPSTFLNR